LLGACAVGPNFHTPAAPAQHGYTTEPVSPAVAPEGTVAGGTQNFVPGAAVERQWWHLFGSPQLDALIDRALKANSDLAAAQAALKVARETWLAQRGILVPQIEAGASSSRNKSSEYLAPVPNETVFTYGLQTAQVSVGYTLDLFGGNRRQVEAARAQYDAQAFQAEASRISLINNVAAAAFLEASLRGQVTAQQRMIAIQTEQLAIVRRQLADGQAAGADVMAQETLLAQTRAALPPLERALGQQQHLLAYLCGGTAADGPVAGLELASLTLPRDLPLSLPSALVRQRPDVRVAEANLHAASAAVGVSIANRLPQLTISASAGGSSGNWTSLLSAANSFWSVAGGLTQPIFAGGALLHRQRAAEAGYKQAEAQYRSAVLTAFQNVADTLQALKTDSEALDAANIAQHSAENSLAVARRQNGQGQVAFSVVLNAEQALRQADQALVQAETARFTDTAALFQALGGGWFNEAGTDAGNPQHGDR
jgi:NodT family efflux transporter outer membrane factor (OMF) lipoprotein